MRQEKISTRQDIDALDVAAVWPATTQLAPVPIPDVSPFNQELNPEPANAAQDVPAGVGRLIVISYAALIGALFLATAGSAYSIYMISISVLFVVMFFTVPRIFLRVEHQRGRRATFERFMHSGMQTLTGHCSGKAALVQMLIVPVFLTLGILAMGVAAAIYL